jgi:SNF2 family DNA or RNA helicase
MIYQPHPYQRDRTDFLINTPAAGLFLPPGLGKTVIALTAINTLRYDRFAVHKVLIIAPKTVAEATWQVEDAKWDHLRHLRISTVLGTAKQRIRALNTPADVYVTGRDNVKWLVDYYRNAWDFDMVILDESTSFKNSRAERFKALRLVRNRINRVVALTGTPASNGYTDLWAQVYLLDLGTRLGRTLTAYRDAFFDPDKRSRTQLYSWRVKDGAADRIEAAIGDICVSLRAEDYLTLPDLITDDIPVVLDAAAQKAYKTLERDLLLTLPDGEITAMTAGVLTGKLLQMCSGALYDADRRVHEIHTAKIDALLELIEQLQGEPCLIFYGYQHDKDRIQRALAGNGLRVRVYQSADDQKAWNNGEVDVLLAHPASCAYGLNLQDGGRHIVWFALTWSSEQYTQAIGRLHRQGQQRTVIVHRLIVCGGMDETVRDALEAKGAAQDALMAALDARRREVLADV